MTFSVKDRSLYLCTPDRTDLAHFVSACIEGGVDIVQLREKHLDAQPLIARAIIVREVCHEYGVPFILNDRPDLALEVEADGVHVGQDDAPVALARKILGSETIVGLSTHHPDEFSNGLGERVDYLSAGPIVPTPTKPGRESTGMGYVTKARTLSNDWSGRSTPLPFFVTGGVTPETIPAIVSAGARKFVVVRYLTESEEPRKAASRLREAIDRSTESLDS
jgi:thiamine-phosphate pyrophosphorylase